MMVNATSGTTVFGAYDPLEGIAAVCEKYDIWLHVDACQGGSIVFSDKLRYSHRLNIYPGLDTIYS